jgi:hypothetical protein
MLWASTHRGGGAQGITSRPARKMAFTPQHLLVRVLCLGLTLAVAPRARAQTHPPEGGAPAAVIAEYRLSTGRSSEPLVLIRTATRIEHRFVGRGLQEVWERQPNGQISLSRLFVNDRKLVSYAPGDLLALGSVPAWSELGSFVSADFKQVFKHAPGSAWRAGLSSQEYVRGSGRSRVRLFWAEQLSLPTSITRGQLRLELKSAQPCTPELCKAASRVGMSDIDFSDLGDREQDPWVRRYTHTGGPGRLFGFGRALLAK